MIVGASRRNSENPEEEGSGDTLQNSDSKQVTTNSEISSPSEKVEENGGPGKNVASEPNKNTEKDKKVKDDTEIESSA